MRAFEPERDASGGVSGVADAPWWTAMPVTATGSDFWSLTPEGRVLALLLSICGFAILGHIAASLATFFIGQAAAAPDSDVAREVVALREDIAPLREEGKGSAPR